MNYRESKNQFNNKLKDQFEPEEISSFWFRLFDHFLNKRRIDFALNPDLPFNEEQNRIFENALERLSKNEPIQHIIGFEWFFNNKFKVSADVLIPRPETEELVDLIINRETNHNPSDLIDLCTGSGCIAISLSNQLKNCKVKGLDYSRKALAIAEENNTLLNGEVQWIHQDLLSCENLNENFDVIISNPPYVRDLEKQSMKSNVLDFEPHMALFVKDNNPLIFYDKIGDLGQRNLRENGRLYLEINQYLAKETSDLLRSKGYSNIEILKDFRKNDRIICCTK